MTAPGVTESVVEEAALAWLESAGRRTAHGPDIVPDMLAAERADYGEVVLARLLRDALARLNPERPADALEDAFRKLTRAEGADLIQRKRVLHRLLADGVTVEYRDAEGAIRGAQAREIDFDAPAINVDVAKGIEPSAPRSSWCCNRAAVSGLGTPTVSSALCQCSGTRDVVPGTSKSHQRAHAHAVLRIPVVIPPAVLVEEFEAVAGPLLERALVCRREVRALAAMRDTLLPKLVSGELRVKTGASVREDVA